MDAIRVDAVRVTRGLSGQELYRILTRTDKLSSRILAELWMHEAEEADYNAEIYFEQMTQPGGARRRETRLEAYLNAHPLHTCEPMPPGWGADYDELPF